MVTEALAAASRAVLVPVKMLRADRDEDPTHLVRRYAPFAVLGFLVEAVAYSSVPMTLFIGWRPWLLVVMLILPTPVHAADFWTENWDTYSVNDETCFTNTNWHKEPGF